MVPPPAGEDVAPRQVREEQNPFFSRLEKLGHSPSSPSSVPPSNARRYGEQSALRYPKTAAGLRFSLQFSTAAEIAGSLFLPPAARACNSPAGGSTAGYRGCQLLHIDRGASRGNPKGARKPRLVVSMREGPGRGRNPKSSPPWCRFLWYLSFGQAKERYIPYAQLRSFDSPCGLAQDDKRRSEQGDRSLHEETGGWASKLLQQEKDP